MSRNQKRRKKNSNYHSDLAKMLGIYIRETRLSHKLSQEAIAKKVGFSIQFYGRIENGTVMAPQGALSIIIRELSLDFNRIMKIYKIAAVGEVESLFGEVSKKSSRAS